MGKKKIVTISSIIVIFLVASFFVGTFYSPYGGAGVYGGLLESKRGTTSSMPGPSTETELTYTSGQTTTQERMVIYNAYISLETSDIQGRLAKIRSLAETLGGYVASSSRSTYGMQTTAEIAIRIPKNKFHAAVQEVETYGKVLDERTTSEDITQQYIDLKARLDNLQKQEQRLREILAMATTIDDVLRVEDELTRVRGDIESLQGQINYLEQNVEMSLISVSLAEPAPPFTAPGMNWGETFQTAITGLFIVLRGLIIITISLIPIVIIGLPKYYLYRQRKQREKK
jgi:hypothetical protein